MVRKCQKRLITLTFFDFKFIALQKNRLDFKRQPAVVYLWRKMHFENRRLYSLHWKVQRPEKAKNGIIIHYLDVQIQIFKLSSPFFHQGVN